MATAEQWLGLGTGLWGRWDIGDMVTAHAHSTPLSWHLSRQHVTGDTGVPRPDMCREEVGDEEEPHPVTSVLPGGWGHGGASLAEVAAPSEEGGC